MSLGFVHVFVNPFADKEELEINSAVRGPVGCRSTTKIEAATQSAPALDVRQAALEVSEKLDLLIRLAAVLIRDSGHSLTSETICSPHSPLQKFCGLSLD